ncbi:hypothetical protein AB833_29930 [Chromatiales bacterium (ex Bugula neritina AB1)]|nr:hypothetical protein AB833_29930 [Chromatiales bacterium (ex Bugula neritina AB1)]
MCADTTQSLLNATAIDVEYGKQTVLSGIDVCLEKGTTLGLLGLNGAGKSTLLKVLAGVCPPSSGTVNIAGADLNTEPMAARLSLGFAPDRPPVHSEFTVTEFLTYAAELRRVHKKQLSAAVSSVIERCGLGEHRHRIIANLSHGYQQRINLAQALVHKPKVLLLDEPTNGLDPLQLMEMRSLITRIGENHATIFSSHLLTEVEASCNQVMLINDGKKLLDLPIDQISNKGGATFEVVLHQAALQTDLQDLPGVLSVCSVDPLHWLVTTNDSPQSGNPASIGEALIARGLQLLEVNPVKNHLERVFNQLSADSTAIGDTQ